MSEDFPTRRSQRLPAHVYRRRRIVAVLLLILVLALIAGGIYGIVQFFSGDDEEPSAGVSPSPVASPSAESSQSEDEGEESESASASASSDEESASESPSESDESAKACSGEDLEVTAATDEDSYAAGENPKFSLEIRNTSESDCTANVGTSQQDFVVKQGDETVFATSYCQVNASDQQLVFVPDQRESAHYTWERLGVDSECSSRVDDLEAGEYELVTKLGDVESDPVKFTLSDDDSSEDADAEDSGEGDGSDS